MGTRLGRQKHYSLCSDTQLCAVTLKLLEACAKSSTTMRQALLTISLALVSTALLSQVENCKCPQGIGAAPGDDPVASYSYSTGETLMICGYAEDYLYSEFDVLECATGASISRYAADQKCSMEFAQDTLRISELKYLPSGANWAWQFERIAIGMIIPRNGQLIALQIVPAFRHLTTSIPVSDQAEFLSYFRLNLDNGLQQDWKWDELLGQLEVIALNGNVDAIDLLTNLENLCNYQLDGAYREQYLDALATLQWIQEN